MKLICSKSNLLHGVNIVSKAVPTRTTMAILECILIDASANEIKLTANETFARDISSPNVTTFSPNI